MPRDDPSSLWSSLSAAGHLADRLLWSAETSVGLDDLAGGSSLGGRLEELRGASVLIASKDQLTAALALIELDSVARRLVLCPPDLPPEYRDALMAIAEVDAIVSDAPTADRGSSGSPRVVSCTSSIMPVDSDRRASHRTEWILLTSGTTGMPKMALHTLSSLTGAITRGARPQQPVVWSTFYDIRRYGGLQIFLRALLDGGSMVFSSTPEPTGDFMIRAGARGVTNISGTPSHWRHALMSPLARKLAPRYVRLSGEIVDQAILDNLRAFYPAATIVHAFASTEAGVAFEVRDGLAGFPAGLIARRGADVETKIQNGSLRIRSARAATSYLGDPSEPLADDEGFVDTRDMVELRDGRYYFVGRRDGIINVGGLKVHPEEVEAVINRHPDVQMSLVKARRNPITGAVVVADIVIRSVSLDGSPAAEIDALKSKVLEACRSSLAPYKVPVAIRVVPSLNVTASGKLARL
jgi:acyl-coenzyme A synthetase/AMP-(fatty) acid ligase